MLGDDSWVGPSSGAEESSEEDVEGPGVGAGAGAGVGSSGEAAGGSTIWRSEDMVVLHSGRVL